MLRKKSKSLTNVAKEKKYVELAFRQRRWYTSYLTEYIQGLNEVFL